MLELQNMILAMVARNEPLGLIAERVCREAEAIAPDIVASILLVDRAGIIHPLASPGLPRTYSDSLDGAMIGPMAGSCGTAAYLVQPVAVTDIARDPRWAAYRDPVLSLGFVACWSNPIIDGDGIAIGTFAFYYRDRRGPTALEREIVDTCLYLCSIAIEHHRWRSEHEDRAYSDPLTGLPNRASFDRALQSLTCERAGAWALLVVDLDNLKIANDTFGHTTGDCMLQTVATRLRDALAPERAFRLGGDEFAILLQTDVSLADIAATAEQILLALEVPGDCNGHIIVPRATVGGAIVMPEDMTPERVRQNADFALYHAKETGRGGFVRYWPGLGSRIVQRLGAIRDVEAGLREGRIEPFYQPIVRLDTREIVGVEALCRLRVGSNHVPAAAFHGATTDVHVATELTRRMMTMIAADVRRWLDMGIPFQHVGINVSSADFHGGKLCRQIEEAFARQNVPLSHVILEVTETVYLGSGDHIVDAAIRQLRAAKLKVALDDFGTGYASLTHLLSMPVDILKIDKSFIDRIEEDEASRAIVEGLLFIARRIGVRIVAEGIETERQHQRLIDMGCILGQGYLFSQPVSAQEATYLLLNQSQVMGDGARTSGNVANNCLATNR